MHDDGLRARLIKGLGASALGQVLVLGSRIVLVPLFLSAWGVDRYGWWLVVASVVAYVAFADVGGQVYILNRLTAAFARGDEALFRRILHTGLALFLVLPGAAVLLVLLVAALAPDAVLGLTSVPGGDPLRLVAVLLAVQAAQFIPLNLVLGVYRAVRMLPRGVMLSNAYQVVHLLLTAGGLALGAGPVAVATIQLVPAHVIGAAAWLDLRGRFPGLRLRPAPTIDLALGRTFVRPSLQFLSILGSSMASTQGAVLVAGAFLGPSAVVLLSAVRAMTNIMRQALTLIAHTAWPEITRLDAQRDVGGLVSLVRGLLRSSLTAAALIVLVLHHLGGWLYAVWLRAAPAYDPDLMGIFLLYGFQQVFWVACSDVLMAINRHAAIARILLLTSCLSLLLAMAAAPILGLRGLVLGLLAGEALLPLWYIPALLRRYEAAFSPAFLLRQLAPAVALAAVGAALPWSVPVVVVALLVWMWRATGAREALGGRRT